MSVPNIFLDQVPEGWFWSEHWGHWQKRNGKVYCYVSPILFGWKSSLYMTGTASMCELEVQTGDTSKEAVAKMFAIAEEWLHKYNDGDLGNIHTDKYSILNPDGVHKKDTYKKGWWI